VVFFWFFFGFLFLLSKMRMRNWKKTGERLLIQLLVKSGEQFLFLTNGDFKMLLSFWYPRKQVVWRRGTMTGKSVSFSEASGVVFDSP